VSGGRSFPFGGGWLFQVNIVHVIFPQSDFDGMKGVKAVLFQLCNGPLGLFNAGAVGSDAAIGSNGECRMRNGFPWFGQI